MICMKQGPEGPSGSPRLCSYLEKKSGVGPRSLNSAVIYPFAILIFKYAHADTTECKFMKAETVFPFCVPCSGGTTMIGI
jgi:hypothetical protein